MLEEVKGGNSKKFSNIIKLEFHFLYKTTCLVNGKVYVGRHSTNDLNDKYLGSGTLLKRAIKKYGKHNFKLEIIDHFCNYRDLVNAEKRVVDKKWCKSDDNYNLVKGGENPVMYGEMNPAWKGGVSKDPNYRKTGKVHNFSKESNPRWGYKYSDIEKEKMVKSQPNRLKIKVKGKTYPSLNRCCKILKRSKDYIQRRCLSSDFPEFKYI